MKMMESERLKRAALFDSLKQQLTSGRKLLRRE